MNTTPDMIAGSLDSQADRLASQYATKLPAGPHRNKAIAALQTAQREARQALGVDRTGQPPETTDH